MVSQTFTIITTDGITQEQLLGCLEDTISKQILEVKEIKKDKESIKINITNEEVEELREGKVFNWCFDGVDVEIYNGEEDD